MKNWLPLELRQDDFVLWVEVLYDVVIETESAIACYQFAQDAWAIDIDVAHKLLSLAVVVFGIDVRLNDNRTAMSDGMEHLATFLAVELHAFDELVELLGLFGRGGQRSRYLVAVWRPLRLFLLSLFRWR